MARLNPGRTISDLKQEKSRSVKSALLGSGYGYIKITQFNQRTTDLMLSALTGMARQSEGRTSICMRAARKT